ncbi:glycosyltransferase family 4 protein [Labilibaculum sp.]|uniref:glycosyltransferase family 4 protein n=1 Tax=Labilibaculum sp. TaxID=2060723 RepID=UPI00356B4A9C
MKVLHLFNEIQFSGAEIMYANAASLFQKEGVELLAFSTGKEMGTFAPVFEREKIRIFHKPIDFRPFSLKGFMYYTSLYRFLKKEKIDVLHIHRSSLNFVAFIAWLANVKCIKTQHSTFQNRKFTRPVAILRRLILRKCLNVTFQTIGESVYENEFHYYKNPSVRINNWFDSKKFFPVKDELEKLAIRKSLSIPEKAFVLISTGACTENKSHKDIIRALALIKDQMNVIYLHLGTGELEQEEIVLTKELGISDQIHYMGNQQNVRDFLVASDVYLMPSKFEGLGNSALEAMACKVPVILNDVAGLRDLIENNDNGFLIAPDYRLMAEKILYYFENPLVAKEKAENAYSFVVSEFSMEKNATKMIDLYKKNENSTVTYGSAKQY